MKNYKISQIGLVISIIIFIGSHISDYDLFEKFVIYLERIEKLEIDELIIPLLILSIFLLIDFFRIQQARQVEVEKIKIYKAMVSSTDYILNNFLNQMLLFKETAEEIPGFDPEILALYGKIIKDTTVQVEALGSLSKVDESSIRKLVTP